jgi:hypothetical protein
MMEDLKFNRLEFLRICKSLESAMKMRDGTHWVSLQFTPELLKMTSNWGEGTVTTNGRDTATGRVAYNHIKRLISSQNLQKSKKETLACILAPDLGKLVIEDSALRLTFE